MDTARKESLYRILCHAALLLFLHKGIALGGAYAARLGAPGLAACLAALAYLLPICLFLLSAQRGQGARSGGAIPCNAGASHPADRSGDGISLVLPRWEQWAAVLPLFPLLLLSVLGISMLTGWLLSLFSLPAVGGTVGDGPLWLLLLDDCLIPALLEEGLLRLALLSLFLAADRGSAPLLSAVCFALMHGSLYQLPYAFAGGLILSLVAMISSSVWPAVLFHFLNNLLSLALQGATDAWVVWAVLAALLLATALALAHLMRNKNSPAHLTLKEVLTHRAPAGFSRRVIASPLGLWGVLSLALTLIALL